MCPNVDSTLCQMLYSTALMLSQACFLRDDDAWYDPPGAICCAAHLHAWRRLLKMTVVVQADQTIQMIIYDNEYQQGASRGTVNAMAADTTQNWTLTLLNGDVSYARSANT